MATFLFAHNKTTLLQLAEEWGVEVAESDLKKKIISKITSASDYDEDAIRKCLEVIVQENDEQKRVREEELAKQFELDKLKIQSSTDNFSEDSARTEFACGRKNKCILKDLVPKFDPKIVDIALFLAIFEKQAVKANINLENYVTQLIPLIPLEIVEIIVKQPADKSDDYNHIKQLLLRRFKLSAGAFKQKFEDHRKRSENLWTDLVHDLRTYLDNWLDAVKVSDFEGLKELLIAEQIKKRVPFNVKEKYLEDWDTMKDPTALAEKCDKFDSAWGSHKKFEKKWEKKPFGNNDRNQNGFRFKKEELGNDEASDKKNADKSGSSSKEVSFEKRRPIRCYSCNQLGHLKYSCPKAKKDDQEKNNLNHVSTDLNLSECFQPYLDRALINGVERDILRDTGSSLDIVERRWIDDDDYTGEVTWVRQPLDVEFKCLPLAWVSIKGEFGNITTKAAVKPVEVEQGYYLLGNKSAELIDRQKQKPNLLNMVVTRSRSRRESNDSVRGESTPCDNSLDKGTNNHSGELSEENSQVEESSLNLPQCEKDSETGLENISPLEFSEAQKNCSTLKTLWERADKVDEKEYFVRDGKLVRVSFSSSGEERVQLCVPLKYKKGILTLCHEETGGHLGTTKTKDRILKCFYWPNSYKEIEEFVRTCDTCQRVGKNRDKKKAPMKLVPVISEIFRKINIDTIGPLKTSHKNNKYCLTSMCLASKYPDAIPLENINSKSIIDGLLQIFSRTGFPKEIQCDLGTSFTSELTSEFFDRFGIKVIHSSVCHPQSSPVERVHSTLKRVIKALCLESGMDWESTLPMALFALRTVTHESTGFSPAELIHGKNLRMPHTILYENWLEKEGVEQNVVDHVLNITNRMKLCQELAEKRMLECRDKRKAWYDKNAVSRKFKVGDQVLVLATSKTHKMAVSWTGPGTITSVISETNYTIDLPDKRNKDTIYHVNLLKPYFKRQEHVNLIMEEEAEDLDDEIEIPYPMSDPTHFDFCELVSNSELENRLSPEQINSFRNVIEKHKKVFSSDPGRTNLVEMDIVLNDDIPVRSKSYRMSPRQTDILREEIRRLLDLGVIEIGQSDYASPMILVESPGKEPRPCVDYRKLNAKTRTEYFPLPNIEEVVEKVSDSEYITLMDLTKGYFQIPLSKRAQRYAAFVTPFGSFIPKVMMFGLLNSGYYFCMLMAKLFGGLELFALPYIDDTAVFSKTWEDHLKHLAEVLKRLAEAKLTVKPIKCRFVQRHVKFLGHEIGAGKRSPSEAKILAIKDFPIPGTKTQIRAFLGMVGYYSRYIQDYSKIAVPLTNLLKGKIRKEKIEWTGECNKAFEKLKAKLMEGPVLYAPDYTKEFIVQTDASLYGAGIVLSQVSEDGEHPIVYLSKKFSRAESNYSTIERELAAIVYALKKLNHYLDGQKFVIQTDHEPLTYLKKNTGTNSRLTRWSLFLQPYLGSIVHRSGKSNGNADGLSRQA